jgi:hypothetical protein
MDERQARLIWQKLVNMDSYIEELALSGKPTEGDTIRGKRVN